MHIIITAHIQNYGDAGYLAWSDQLKGVMVQANSLEEAKAEMWKSLKIKVAYETGIALSAIEGHEIGDDLPNVITETEDQFTLQLF